MAFTPRLNAPSTADKYWLRPSSGGYNQCINISGGSVLPNCVGYAYGRFMEIMSKTPVLKIQILASPTAFCFIR